MQPLNDRHPLKSRLTSRLLAVYLLVLVWGICLVGRLVQLQVFQSQEYRERAEQQRAAFLELAARRGDILDRNLGELAITVRGDGLWADPDEIQSPLRVARLLAPLLQKNPEELYGRLSADRTFVYLKRNVPPRQIEQIRRLNLVGCYFEKENRRYYPASQLASHVLGFVGVDGQGLGGLEYLYNHLIRGQKSRVYLRVDARRKSYSRLPAGKQTQGHTLVLNLDRRLQYVAEQVLHETVESSKALSGSVILMDPNNGEVLAMASYPTFNPNHFSDYDGECQRNRAILESLEPGSVFKVVTFSAVLNEGLADLDERIDCRVGTVRLAGKVYHEAARSYGELAVDEIIAKSSNVGTIKMALRLGPERLSAYLKRFGFGQKTGVDLPGEQVGLLRPLAQWSRTSIGAIAIGQEVGVTPLQMLRAVSAVANGGYLVQPRIVRRILTSGGDLITEFRPIRHRILRPETSNKMTKALALVVKKGTGSRARLTGYSSGGKTGTAQKFIDGHYSKTRYVASYVGFAPLSHPVLSAIVVINEPRNGYYGGRVAAPAFKEVMERALICLKVPRDEAPTFQVAEKGRAAGEPDETTGVSVREEQIPAERLEQTVLSLIEHVPEGPRIGHVLTVKTGLIPMPDFSGRGLRSVARECARLGLALKVSGSGVAVGQRPIPGSRVRKGAVCEVFFSMRGSRLASGAIAEQGSSPLGGGGH
ncbi:MAG: penicillin-binding protein [Acidobacteriota bacterium]